MANGNGSVMTSTAAMTLAGTGPAVVKADQTRAFEPRDISEGYQLAKLLVGSGLLGRNVVRPEQAFTIIAAGRELGLTAMQSLRSIHIIEGKPTLSVDLIAALCKSRPDVCVYFRMVESTAERATYETQRKGEPSPTRMSWTIQEAKDAGLVGKDNWRKYPAAMLRARCITALARAVYPDLAMGLYDPDEIDTTSSPPQASGSRPEVVVTTDAPSVEDRAFQDLCDRVDAAETVAALGQVAAAATKMARSKKLTKEQYDSIKEAYAKKKALLQPTPPTPPQSAPDSGPPDPDPHNDAADELQDMVQE